MLVAAAFLCAAPAAATGVHVQNVAFLSGLLGDPDPSSLVVPVTGPATTAAAALDAAATRAGEVDLESLYRGAQAPLVSASGGEVWVLEVGLGPCVIGALSSLTSSHGYLTIVSDRTLGSSTYEFNTGGFETRGQVNVFCFRQGNVHLAFPIVNGVASVKDA
ncbi:MAG TPA: hypothetical protein VM370_01360 [Candidatus Thermoplasmatota archaeon]|nr:hypothetical protein [Candidatus Thermoplasmatota archaeon]